MSPARKMTVSQIAREILEATVSALPQDQSLMDQCSKTVRGLTPQVYVFEVLCLKFFVSFVAVRSAFPPIFWTAFLDQWDSATRAFSDNSPPRVREFAYKVGFADPYAGILQRTAAYSKACDEGPKFGELDITSRAFARFCCGNQHQKDLWRVAHFYYNIRRNEILALLKSMEIVG